MLKIFTILAQGKEIFKISMLNDIEKSLFKHLNLEKMVKITPDFKRGKKYTISQIKIANYFLFNKNYGDFTICLLLSSNIKDTTILEGYFNDLAKEVIYHFTMNDKQPLKKKDELKENIELILKPLTKLSLVGSLKTLKKETLRTKIGLIGLGYAGKSSISKKFFDSWSNEQISNIKPTFDTDFSNTRLTYLNKSIAIMDFGGQLIYRDAHLKRLDIWKGFSAFIFVIDIQDPDTFDLSKQYLDKIWSIVMKIDDIPPKLSILFHKFDENKREILDENVRKCVCLFKDYEFASFYLTTIEDRSSDIAIIKTLYFSLPQLVIRKILEIKLMDQFDEEIMPSLLAYEENKRINEENNAKEELKELCYTVGTTCGNIIQLDWLKSVVGEIEPNILEVKEDTNSVVIEIIGNTIIITLQLLRWNKEIRENKISKDLLINVFSDLLSSLLNTFKLGNLNLIENTKDYLKWKINI